MPDLKISALPVATTPLAGTELVPVVQSATTKQTTVAAILTGTVPSGTANGVMYLNGSKVATTGSALTFDGTALGAARAIFTAADSAYAVAFNAPTGNARISGYDSTYGGTALVTYSAGYAGYGPFTVDALNHRWWVSNTEQMRLTSTGLGIGTTSPATKLHVDTAGAGYGLTLAASSLTGRTYRFGLDSVANLALFDSTAAAVRLTLDTSGNLIQKVNATAPTLSTNSTMSFELTSNTSLKIVVRGTDGTTRSVSLTLA